MKTDKKNIKIIGISLPAYLLKKVDKKAIAQFQNRSEYIKNLILLDLELATISNKTKKGS